MVQQLKVPAMSAASSAGYDPIYVSSGAFRTMSYRDWKDEQAAKAGIEGRRWKAGADYPDTKPDGTTEGLSHRAESPEEIIQFFNKMMRAADTLDADKRKLEDVARANQALGDLGELARKAAGGDGAALHEALRMKSSWRSVVIRVAYLSTPSSLQVVRK